MHFELLESLSLPSDASRPNEDSFASGARFAAVLDGATGLGELLMPGRSDAQWLAQFGARRLKAHAEAGDATLRDALRAAASDAEKSFTALRKRAPKENYELPFASLMAVSIDDALNAIWFGDCAAVIHSPDNAIMIIGETIVKRAKERERVTRLAGPAGAAATEVRKIFLPALRASRNKVNTKDSEWLFAPDAACAEHVSETRLKVSPGSRLLLATDGFLALISDYEKYSPESLMTAAETRGLVALGQELRAVESEDPEGRLYPRFKKSDDATALLLSVTR